MRNFSKNVYIKKLSVSGGTTSEALDMQGYAGVCFVSSFSAAHASNALKVQQATAEAGTFADLTGGSIAPGAVITDCFIDFYKPTERYVRAVATLGGAAELGDLWAFLYTPQDAPVDNDRDDLAGVMPTSPAES